MRIILITSLIFFSNLSFSSSFQEREQESNQLKTTQNVSDIFQSTVIASYSFHTLLFMGFSQMAFAEDSSTDESPSPGLFTRIRRAIVAIFRYIASFFQGKADTENDQEKSDTYQEQADLYKEKANIIELDIEMDEDMKQCKIEIEQVRIKRNTQLLEAAGVNSRNIDCFSHPEDTSNVESWYIERAGGVCYDKTAQSKPSLSDSIGSEGRTPPKTRAEKEAYLEGCKGNLERLQAEVAASSMDREMAQCKLEVEQVRMRRNRQLLTEAGVDRNNIECFSHYKVCMTAASGSVCRPVITFPDVNTWYIERAGGICYDTTGEKPSSNGMGSEGRTLPQNEAEKKKALEGCKNSLALLEAEVASSTTDRKMAQCKSDIEQVRIKRNTQLLLAAGVETDNIECFSHPRGCMQTASGSVCRPAVSSDVKSWYTEKAWGVCYDKTGEKPSVDGMGSHDQALPETQAEKEAILKTCQDALKQLQAEAAASDMDREMAQCKIEIEELRMQKNKLELLTAGVDPKNIDCFFHPKVCMEAANGKVCRPTVKSNVSVESWYIEKAQGVCYDKTAQNKLSSSASMGISCSNSDKELGRYHCSSSSNSRTLPKTEDEKKEYLERCKTNLAKLLEELGQSPDGARD